MTAEEERTYETAVERLDQIIKRLDSGEAELRETLDLCGEAKELVEYCAKHENACALECLVLAGDNNLNATAVCDRAIGGNPPVYRI